MGAICRLVKEAEGSNEEVVINVEYN